MRCCKVFKALYYTRESFILFITIKIECFIFHCSNFVGGHDETFKIDYVYKISNTSCLPKRPRQTRVT